MIHEQKLIITSFFLDTLATVAWGIVVLLIYKLASVLPLVIIAVILTVPVLIISAVFIDKFLKKHFNDTHIQQESDEQKKALLIKNPKRKFFKLYIFIAISALSLALIYLFISHL